MQDFGDDTGSSLGRALNRLFEMYIRNRRPPQGRSASAAAERELSLTKECALARAAKFEAGDPENARLSFETVDWDPRAEIIADPLVRAGIGYEVAFPAPGTAVIEVNRAAGPYLARLAQRYIDDGHIAPSRFPNLDEVKACASRTGTREPGREEPIQRVVANESRSYKSIVVEDRESYDLLAGIYSAEGVRFFSEWDGDGREGTFVLEAEQFAHGERAVRAALDDLAAGKVGTEDLIGKSPELDALENDRVALLFKTLDRDREASIITNALAREGVEGWAVTEPDYEGKVVVSVRSSDSPRLVAIADDYADKGTIDRARFENLEDVRRRAEARKPAARPGAKSGKSPARADENARRAADARNRDAAIKAPARAQAR